MNRIPTYRSLCALLSVAGAAALKRDYPALSRKEERLLNRADEKALRARLADLGI